MPDEGGTSVIREEVKMLMIEAGVIRGYRW